MQSAWLARVYEALWRPTLFGLSTRLGAPSAEHEARLVIGLIELQGGPWLDLSCGPGTLLRHLVAAGGSRTVIGLDLSRAMLERASRAAPSARLVRADAEELPFEDETFGAVANLAALDLYPDPARVVAEAARVLAPGGRWVCSTFVKRARASSSAPGTRSPDAAGARKPAIEELAGWVKRAGLRRFGNRPFRGYTIAWADKD
jgi:ubiquinone/menaquinone biosynthesis C-methylase UbiE